MQHIDLPGHLTNFVNQLAGFAIIDRTGHYLYVSEAWSKAMGHTVEDLLGKTAQEVFPDTQSPIAIETGQKIIGHPVKWGANKVPGFTNYYPFFLSDGSVGGCYCLVILEGMDNARLLQNQIAELSSELEYLRQELKKENASRYNLDDIIGSSPKMVALKAQLKKVARSNSSVLIEGETGTGKELVAHAIHSLSRRSESNFVRVNCAAIPPELMEAEFFGYKKGSFTGADPRGRVGKFQFANHGSIFLDEINSLPLQIQPKFLRVLQEREIEPIGSSENVAVDIRIIAAANTALEKQVAEGKFRSDLYYRLNVIRIVVPPLRERKEDIPELVVGLIHRLNKNLGTFTQSVSPAAMKLLIGYDWPGNIRELQNALESAMNVADSPILRPEDFFGLNHRIRTKKYMQSLGEKGSYHLQTAKAAFEKDLILEVLRHNSFNHSKSAQELGISRTMLYKKIDQYQIGEE